MEQHTQSVWQAKRLIFLVLAVFQAVLSASPGWSLESVDSKLTRFNTPGVVQLTGNLNEFSVKVPIPERWLVDKATLRLAYVNSMALLASRSQLVVLYNQVPVAQVALLPNAPEGVVTVSIPVHLFEPGYNDLTFRVAQDFKDEDCIPPDPPEVWTTLKLADSSLSISYDLKEIPRSLAAASDFLFDPRMHEENEVHLVVQDYTPQLLELATLAASGVALRFDYRNVHFSIGQKLRKGMDNILLGKTEFVDRLLTAHGIQRGNNHLGITYLPISGDDQDSPPPPDQQHALLYLSGDNLEIVRRSVEMFSALSFPLPDTAACQVEDVRLPDITRFSGKNVVAPKKDYLFKELGWNTTTYRGHRGELGELPFTLPTDLLLEENRMIELSFNLVYSAKMRADSLLSIDLNNKFIASIPLDNDQGGFYQAYQIRLPLRYLKPGRNTLTLRPVLTPLISGDCKMTQSSHLAVTVFDDSKLIIPDMTQYTDMPHLEYLLDDGFPLAGLPDFRETEVILPEINQQSAASMINLVSMISQRIGVQPFKLRIRQAASVKEEKNLLVIGRLAAIPRELTEASPLVPAIHMGFSGRLPGTIREKSWLDTVRERIYPENLVRKPVTPDTVALSTPLVIGRQKALFCEYESPFTAMRSVVLVTADTFEDLSTGIENLGDSTVREQIRDEISLIDFKTENTQVKSGRLTEGYHSGQYTVKNMLSYLVDKITWQFYAVLALLLVILAVLLTALVKRRRKRRLAEAEEVKSKDR